MTAQVTHDYIPDAMAMGDCRRCGRLRDDPVHSPPSKPAAPPPEGERERLSRELNAAATACLDGVLMSSEDWEAAREIIAWCKEADTEGLFDWEPLDARITTALAIQRASLEAERDDALCGRQASESLEQYWRKRATAAEAALATARADALRDAASIARKLSDCSPNYIADQIEDAAAIAAERGGKG